MFVADEVVVAVMGWWLFGWWGPLAAPSIPRSLRSRPFRPTKGAECVLTCVLW